MHHGRFSNNRLELVYTKYEVNRSIIKEDGCIQPFRAQNPVFSTLTTGPDCAERQAGAGRLRERRGVQEGAPAARAAVRTGQVVNSSITMFLRGALFPSVG